MTVLLTTPEPNKSHPGLRNTPQRGHLIALGYLGPAA